MAPLAHDDDDARESIAYVTPGEPTYLRSTFGIKPDAYVRGWPSTGGIYILEDCDGVELGFVGLDRFGFGFHSTLRSWDSVEEDAHCAKMWLLGATWWRSERAYAEKHLPELNPEGPDKKTVVVGWPSGPDGGAGVWVLRTTYDEGVQKGVGRVKNAGSMDERCRVIERLGGVFYARPEECPGLDLELASGGRGEDY